jgi:hypothetical protein
MTGIQAIKEMSLNLHKEIQRLRAIETILRSDTEKAIALFPALAPLLTPKP